MVSAVDLSPRANRVCVSCQTQRRGLVAELLAVRLQALLSGAQVELCRVIGVPCSSVPALCVTGT